MSDVVATQNDLITLDRVERRLVLPAYRYAEAARLAQTTTQTVARWQRLLAQAEGGISDQPQRDSAETGTLSFLGLVEAALATSFRHLGIKMNQLSEIHSHLREEFQFEHPFALSHFR